MTSPAVAPAGTLRGYVGGDFGTRHNESRRRAVEADAGGPCSIGA
jgi:hypothetical protein